MQESRRRRWLQLHLLSLIGSLACASSGPGPGTSPSNVNASVVATGPAKSLAEPLSSASAGAASTESPAPASEATFEVAAASAELPRGTRVLHIGDSFAAALGIPLGKRLREAGLRSWLEYKTASYVPTWASDPELPKLLDKFSPDLVLVTLGANEVEIVDAPQRARTVQRLVKKLGARPCVWILPPLWKADTGLMQVIKDNASPCRVLDSSALVGDLPRGPDKIHPSSEGRERWADAVFEWLKRARLPDGEKPWSLRAETPAALSSP
jgi:hypothetical protein